MSRLRIFLALTIPLLLAGGALWFHLSTLYTPPSSDHPERWWDCTQSIVDDAPTPASCLTDGTVVP